MKPLASLALTLTCCFTALPCLAEEILLSAKDRGLSFTLAEHDSDTGNIVSLRVKLPPDAKVATLVLEDPLRVVIDLPPSKGIKNKTLNIPNAAMLRALRIGSHQDKLRLVLDLRGTTPPEVSVLSTAKGTTIELRQGSSSDVAPANPTPFVVATVQVIVPVIEPTIAAADTRVPEATATPLAATPTTVPTTAPTVAATHTSPPATPTLVPATNTPIPTATPSLPSSTPTAASTLEQSANPHILEFGFEYSGSEHVPVIRITLSDRSEFKLSKADERLYKLNIPGSSLSSLALKLPQFPPHDFTGFTFLQAEQLSGAVEVKIGVERGTRISALPQDKDILIRSLAK